MLCRNGRIRSPCLNICRSFVLFFVFRLESSCFLLGCGLIWMVNDLLSFAWKYVYFNAIPLFFGICLLLLGVLLDDKYVCTCMKGERNKECVFLYFTNYKFSFYFNLCTKGCTCTRNMYIYNIEDIGVIFSYCIVVKTISVVCMWYLVYIIVYLWYIWHCHARAVMHRYVF